VRRVFSSWILVLVSAAIPSLSQTTVPTRLIYRFSPGQAIHVRLSAGNYFISGSDSESIRVSYSADTPEQEARAKATLVNSNSAPELQITDTPKHEFLATITVPRRSDLWVRMSKGDLRIAGVSGNKDVETRRGNIIVEVVDPQEYGTYDVSVTAGSLEVRAWHVSKLGLWRSLHKQTPGRHHLRAHVGIGSVAVTFGLENNPP
jgi:hypothetical protein